jgi:ABC-type glycerol-3-phosphate transport system permease component
VAYASCRRVSSPESALPWVATVVKHRQSVTPAAVVEEAVKPISAGLLQFFSENAAEWTLIAAAILITASPLVLLYVFAQRYIIAGVTGGALKG